MTTKKKRGTQPAPKKIAIFGTTPSRMEGPVQDDSGWERWTIGPGGNDAHNWERLYEVHSWWPEDFKGYLGMLSQVQAPRKVYSLQPMPRLMQKWKNQHGKSDADYAKDIPGDWSANVVIDRPFLESKYGRTWFSSSISWSMLTRKKPNARVLSPESSRRRKNALSRPSTTACACLTRKSTGDAVSNQQ